MKSDFIELHAYYCEEPFMVNRRMIVRVEPMPADSGEEDDEIGTMILSGIDEPWVSVSERYEDVKRMLMGDNNAESNDNRAVYI